MKTTKRILASLLAMVLVVAMMVLPASAAGTYTITIDKTPAGHEFKAYQIFTGDLSGRVLSNIVWGQDVNGSALLEALKTNPAFDGKFVSAVDAEDVAQVMENTSIWNNAYTDKFAQAVNEYIIEADAAVATYDSGTETYTLTVPGGYYFIKDFANVSGNYDAITKYMIEVTDNSTISPKVELPKLTKTVALSETGSYSEAVSANIGGTVYFNLTANLVARVNDYPEYYLAFEDTLPTGVTFDEIKSVKVSNYTIDFAGHEYGFDYSVAGDTVTFTLPEAKKAVTEKTGADVNANDKVEIIFSANVTKAIGINATTGNTNKAVLHYSSDPNTNMTTYDDRLAKTNEAQAKVYSYALAVKKVDAAAPTTTALSGAQFYLYRMEDSTKYYAVVADAKLTGWSTDTAAENLLVSGANGFINVAGLRKDTYYLQEIKAPETYNKTSDIVSVTVQAEFDKEHGTVKNFDASVTGHGVADLYKADADTGIVTVYFSNSKGATLPETGGMGTTIFYIVGGAMMIGAAAVLFTKKRGTQK